MVRERSFRPLVKAPAFGMTARSAGIQIATSGFPAGVLKPWHA